MKEFTITVSGKTLDDVLNAIDEAKKGIESGTSFGFNSNDDGEFEYESEGDYEEEIEYLVNGYATKKDFDNAKPETIDEYISKEDAETIAKEEIESGNWYAVKVRDVFGEESEVTYKKSQFKNYKSKQQ